MKIDINKSLANGVIEIISGNYIVDGYNLLNKMELYFYNSQKIDWVVLSKKNGIYELLEKDKVICKFKLKGKK